MGDCDRNTMSATTSCSSEANTVVKRTFARQFHDGCLVVGSAFFKACYLFQNIDLRFAMSFCDPVSRLISIEAQVFHARLLQS